MEEFKVTISPSGQLQFVPTVTILIYSQGTEPVLASSEKLAMWINTTNNKVYLVFRRGNVGSGYTEQVKVELI